MTQSHLLPRARRLVLVALASFMALAGAQAASARAAGSLWSVASVATPSNFLTSQNEACEELEVCDEYHVTIINVGNRASHGSIVIRDTLPPGMVTVLHSAVLLYGPPHSSEGGEPLECTPPSPTAAFTCETTESVGSGEMIEIRVHVHLEAGVEATALNHVEVEEAGNPQGPVSTSSPATMPNTVNQQDPEFGPQDFAVGVYGGQLGADTLAGDHPSSVSVKIDATTKLNPQGGGEPVQEPRSEIVDLPLGFVGNPLAAAQCPESTVYGRGQPRECPAASQVGIIAIANHLEQQEYRIYNMVPEPGYPATFAFEIAETVVLMPVRVLPSAQGYELSVGVPAIPRSKVVKITGLTLTFFGDPGEQNGSGSQTELFTNPVDCGASPLKARLEMDSWVDPQDWVPAETTVYEADALHAVTGCEALQFNPTLEASMEGGADSPAALNMQLQVPQAADAESIPTTPYLRNLELQLPEGVSLSPSAAEGLRGCPATGSEGIELGNQDRIGEEAHPGEADEAQAGEELGEDGMPHAAAGHCPSASQIGTVEAATPVLATPLVGHVYLAEPGCGTAASPSPCSAADVEDGQAFRVYIELAGSGVVIKVMGTVTANASTGRLTVHFNENPQFPLSALKVHLNGGPRAALATPQKCGTTQILGSLVPWSAPGSGPAAEVLAPFTVGGCPSSSTFAPAVLAQAAQAGALAHPTFTFNVSRADGEPDLAATSVSLPPGLLANVGSVPRCANAAAAAGTCAATSAIGTVEVEIGAGTEPFHTSGTVYLTEAYEGAPFGLAIVVPTTAGPFTLAGNTGAGTEVVRAAVRIDPTTAAVSIQSDPLPQVIDGVPIRLRSLTVTVNRPGFMVNPSNCKQMAVGATVEGAGPVAETVSRPFAVSGCKGLGFAPKLSVSTGAVTSKAAGASLQVGITTPAGEANIATVKVDLPVKLPSRLTTLQKACTEATFTANPSSCPAASLVGTATAVTPLLAAHLVGPAYLVSHAGAAFPDLVMVLQGEGVTIELTGNTSIKHGVTSSTFKYVPDAPITSFELTLPRGPNSLLSAFLPASAHRSFCGQELKMPTRITGQNGGVLQQTTDVAVTGCPKHVAKKVTKKRTKHPKPKTHSKAKR